MPSLHMGIEQHICIDELNIMADDDAITKT